MAKEFSIILNPCLQIATVFSHYRKMVLHNYSIDVDKVKVLNRHFNFVQCSYKDSGHAVPSMDLSPYPELVYYLLR